MMRIAEYIAPTESSVWTLAKQMLAWHRSLAELPVVTTSGCRLPTDASSNGRFGARATLVSRQRSEFDLLC